ncbi:Uncharacterised protein [Mesomycoplasma hyorhinis]|nr:Uncharacterised protein [Mesomycoplasma hyorhinis]
MLYSLCVSLNSYAIALSIGKIILSQYFSSNSLANSILSSSTIEIPISNPNAFLKVYDIPPAIKTLSAFSNNEEIIPILSEIFAPPTIATKGLFGLSINLVNAFSSFSTK